MQRKGAFAPFFCCIYSVKIYIYTVFILIFLSMTAWIIVALWIWGAFWYLFFYFRYENRELVSELRLNLKKTQKDAHQLRLDFEEHYEQNRILKEQLTELYRKNDDLVRVVSDLSRYYYHMKIWAQKVQDLSQFLELPDAEMEQKMKQYVSSDMVKKESHSSQDLDTKKFF